MKPWTEQEEIEYKEMTAKFTGYLKKAFEDGEAQGWTEQQIREANPILFAGVDAIDRIATCSVDELHPIGICVYCDQPVLKKELYVNDKVLLHKDCENDVMAEIQDQSRNY